MPSQKNPQEFEWNVLLTACVFSSSPAAWPRSRSPGSAPHPVKDHVSTGYLNVKCAK